MEIEQGSIVGVEPHRALAVVQRLHLQRCTPDAHGRSLTASAHRSPPTVAGHHSFLLGAGAHRQLLQPPTPCHGGSKEALLDWVCRPVQQGLFSDLLWPSTPLLAVGAAQVLCFWTAREGGTRASRLTTEGGASRRCCRFSESPRGGVSPRASERGREAEAPGQPKSLGTDAFTASQEQGACTA